MRLASIVGARPQFIKIAPFALAYAAHNRGGEEPIEDVIVHTGQHYDATMSDVFFRDLDLPAAAYNLGTGSGSQAAQTARMLEGIERVLLEVRPDAVVVFGDTNSTVAGSLAAAKLHLPVAHVEAGLRSFNRRMPEEINRVVTDHLSDVLYAPTATAMDNLAREGLGARAQQCGDSMYDAVLHYRQQARERSRVHSRFSLVPDGYAVVTIHRAENTDDATRLRSLLEALNRLASERALDLVFPIHPRTRARLAQGLADWRPHARLKLVEPTGYLDMLALVDRAQVVLTDSGGLQKEALFLGCPCVTLRDETEWVETVACGANILAGTDPDRIVDAVATLRERHSGRQADFPSMARSAFGDGRAAERIAASLLAFVRRH